MMSERMGSKFDINMHLLTKQKNASVLSVLIFMYELLTILYLYQSNTVKNLKREQKNKTANFCCLILLLEEAVHMLVHS